MQAEKKHMRSAAIVIWTMGAWLHAGCQPKGGLKLNAGTATTVLKAKDDFECQPASIERRYFCTKDKALLGQETTLLGTIYKVEKVDGACPEPLSEKEHREAILPGLDKQSLSLTNAVTTQVDFALVKRDVTSKVRALAFLTSSLDGNAVASVELTRTTRSVIEDGRLNKAVAEFAERHPTACRLYVTTGYAADYFTARVFTSAKANAGGGVYGVNVGGSYFASDETVKRDYQWALSIVKIDVGVSSNKDVFPKPILVKEPPVTDRATAEVTTFELPPRL
jgi:hypothetical protein